MKTFAALVAAGLLLGLSPAGAGQPDHTAANQAFLRQWVQQQHPGVELPEETLQAIAQVAAWTAARDVAEVFRTARPLHAVTTPAGEVDVGEVWTFQPGPISGVLGPHLFCAAVPTHWAYFQWVTNPNVWSGGAGTHFLWTTDYLGLTPMVGQHSSFTHAGTVCGVNTAFFSATFGNPALLH